MRVYRRLLARARDLLHGRLLGRLPLARHGAVFRVVYVDPDGSGMDYQGHLGLHVYNAQRCCKSCPMIFAAMRPGGEAEIAFVDHELAPVNAAARQLAAEIGSERSTWAPRLVPLPEDGRAT